MKQYILLLFVLSLVFVSCSQHQKKILVYASGSVEVDATGTNVVIKPGTTHQEKELDFKQNGPVTLNFETPSGKVSLEAKEDGLYIANLKKDTLVGSYQHTGEYANSRITQDKLKTQLDSLTMLVKGEHLQPANRNYFLPTNTIVKISGDVNSKVFGPYSPIPRGFDASAFPEIFKFYTTAQEWEIIGKLTEMSTFHSDVPAAPATP